MTTAFVLSGYVGGFGIGREATTWPGRGGVCGAAPSSRCVPTAPVAGTPDVRVMAPLCPLTVAASDFGHARELVDRTQRAAGEWLDSGRTSGRRSDRSLSLHEHRGGATSRDRVEVDPHGQQLGAQ
ncbi:MAG: hypothetical protein M3211_02035 [Actinomycetota bacterium]|nr:hypothetical protein [Actinomycetota bacterium]